MDDTNDATTVVILMIKQQKVTALEGHLWDTFCRIDYMVLYTVGK